MLNATDNSYIGESQASLYFFYQYCYTTTMAIDQYRGVFFEALMCQHKVILLMEYFLH